MDHPPGFQQFEHQVEAWVAQQVGTRRERVTIATTINRQLGVTGDEAKALLALLAARSGASFETFPASRYFARETIGQRLIRRVGQMFGQARSATAPLTVRALAEFMWTHGGRLPEQR